MTNKFLTIAFLAFSMIFHASSSLGADDPPSSIERALGFLYSHQVRQPLDGVEDGVRVVDWPGNWPQYFSLQGGEALRVRDVSPFTVAFIHHALTYIVADNRQAAGLSMPDVVRARSMRQRAVAFMRRFASAPGAPDAGTFAFWPYDADPFTPDLLTTLFLTVWLQGPILGGQRVPLNLAIFPSTLAIPSDADVTATTYATLLDDALVDGGPVSTVPFERFFVDWRDLGVVPRRVNPSWLPPASGAFLTWLTYRQPPGPLFPNDVDIVVNANVLYALARYNRRDVPGVAEAVAVINRATALGLHRAHLEEITTYYPKNLALQYIVSRAYHEGPVPALAPAVRTLADDLEASVQMRADGAAYWNLGDPHLNTAFAVLTLLNAGRAAPLIDRAVRYLLAEQQADGGFDEATFFVGRTDGGPVFEYTSASFTTAMVLEALVRYRLARCPPAKSHLETAGLEICN